MEYSKDLVQFCDRSYDDFLNLSLTDFYKYKRNFEAQKCVSLYGESIWESRNHDIQLIEKFVYDETMESNQKYLERKISALKANLSAGLLPVLSDLYEYQKQKIEFIEDYLEKERIQNTPEN